MSTTTAEVLIVPDEQAASLRAYVRANPDIRKDEYAHNGQDPLAGACYPLAESYYHLRDCEPDVYCLSWSDVDETYDGTHWYLRESGGSWIDLSLSEDATDFPLFEVGRRRGFITGDKPSKRARKILDWYREQQGGGGS